MKNPSIVGKSEKYKQIIEKNKLYQKFNKYMHDRAALPYTVYKDTRDDVWYYHFNIESESDSEVIYDVVIEFSPDNKELSNETTLKNYLIRLFSNSPGFSFTYAYAYAHYKILIPEFANKFPEKVLKERPNKTNPELAIGYDYTIFFAMYFLILNDYHLRKTNANRIAKDIKQFNYDMVLSAEAAMQRRSESSQGIIHRLEKEVKARVVKPVSKMANKVERVAGKIISKTPFASTSKRVPVKKPIKATKSTRFGKK
jgi:hypothetical protein